MHRDENVCKPIKLAREPRRGFSVLIVATVMATATLFCSMSGGATEASSEAALLSPTGLFPSPVNLPSGPQTSAQGCPNPPELSAPLPAGASISAPSLVPDGVASLVVGTQSYDLSGTCAYTLTLAVTASALASAVGSVSADTISITYIDPGNDLYFPTGAAEPIDFSYNGRYCDTTAEIVTAFGYAIAEQELDIGNCTSNGYDPSVTWGYADAANTAEQLAPIAQEPNFGDEYLSDEVGTIFFGQFQECMEAPVGQQSSYVCLRNNYGPLF
jgi:hypothetical protein